MSICFSCAEPLQGNDGNYHPACLKLLFGTEQLPTIDVDLARLHTLALAMVGRVSISGVQRKLSVNLDPKRSTLQIAVGGANYLLKPQANTFPDLPQNEWITQRLAVVVGIHVPACALIVLADNSLAYIVRRFDRTDAGTKLAMEDFCQLSALPPASKYDSTAENCAKLVRRYASEPLVELLRLYRQFVFSWWVGNGDMHLKNLALLRQPSGHWQLSPAFDQLNTRLVLPNDSQALPMCGKRDNIKPKTLEQLADRFEIGAKAALRVRDELHAALPKALGLIANSPLSEDMREQYAEQLTRRALT